MDANIIYPDLVEEAYQLYQSFGKDINKRILWQNMVRLGILDSFGQPTTAALEAGMVREFVEEENLSLAEFRSIYPVFDRYEDGYFILQDGFWQVRPELLEQVQADIKLDLLNEEDIMELEAYFDNQIDEII